MFYSPFEIVDNTLTKCFGASDCRSFDTNEFPDVTKIAPLAFKGNQTLQSIYIGPQITAIGVEAFSCCPHLDSIVVDEDNPRYTSMNGSNCIIDKVTNSLILGCSKTKIPDSICSIGPFAFCGQIMLQEIHIPSNVKKLYPYAFDGCESLHTLKMDDGLEEIGGCCFRFCNNLKTLYVPQTLITIDQTAFGVLFGEFGISNEGDVLVHEIYYSGERDSFIRHFNVSTLFSLNDNLSYNDMTFHCKDGDFAWSITHEDLDNNIFYAF